MEKSETHNINIVEIIGDSDSMPERKEYHIQAKFVKDFQKTPAKEDVAWNGTLMLYKAKGKFYLWYHSGNSSHKGYGVLVPSGVDVEGITAEEAMRIFLP